MLTYADVCWRMLAYADVIACIFVYELAISRMSRIGLSRSLISFCTSVISSRCVKP
jgi:hypothetical protein